MSEMKTIDSSRRAFFLKGGTALGVGLASATVAANVLRAGKPSPEQLRLATLEDQTAIRQLHLAFTTLMEQQAYDSVVALFTDDGDMNLHGVTLSGRPALEQLLVTEYGQHQAAVMHTAFRQDQRQQHDEIDIWDDHLHADALFHMQVQVSMPQTDQSVASQMTHRWQDGSYEVDYFKVDGQWRICDMVFRQA